MSVLKVVYQLESLLLLPQSHRLLQITDFLAYPLPKIPNFQLLLVLLLLLLPQ
jgi:hypothetical protein